MAARAAPRRHRWPDLAVGILFAALMVTVSLQEWHLAGPTVRGATDLLMLVAIALMFWNVPTGRRMFVVAAIAMTLLAALRLDDWHAAALRALGVAAFIAAFFTALATLGEAARQSPAIRRCGLYIASRPPGRRYGALTLGGILFSLLLNYGSIFLLGSLATASADEEPDPAIRALRRKRMLLAVERAMGATLTWSPLAISITMSTLLIEGLSWGALVLPGLVSGAIVALSGWALDSWLRPRRPAGRAPAPARAEGSLRDTAPLVLLLAILGTIIITLHLVTGIRIPGLVIVVVPLVALGWTLLQEHGSPAATTRRAADFVTTRIPAMQPEMAMISMSAYIGLLGGEVFAPVLAAAGIDLAALPVPLLLTGLIVLVALAGQVAMNPFLASVLVIPLLPSPAELGITPVALGLAVCAGWTVNAMTSPFTAMAVIVGRMAQVSPWRVGVVWNGLFTLVAGTLLIGWVVLYAALAG